MSATDPQGDPQTHLDTDPVNRAETSSGSEDDRAHDAGRDEGREPEAGTTPTDPATDT